MYKIFITYRQLKHLRLKGSKSTQKTCICIFISDAASSSAILPGKTRHVPLPPVNPRPKSNLPFKRHGQVPALQITKLPPINTATKKIR